jgi:hypothetical protein
MASNVSGSSSAGSCTDKTAHAEATSSALMGRRRKAMLVTGGPPGLREMATCSHARRPPSTATISSTFHGTSGWLTSASQRLGSATRSSRQITDPTCDLTRTTSQPLAVLDGIR